MKSVNKNLTWLTIIIIVASGIFLIAFTSHAESNSVNENSGNNSGFDSASNDFPCEIGNSGTYKNLQVFFLSAQNHIIDKEYIPLSEAMDKKYITVFETENVNQLAVENLSDQFVFICSGDIVKGGKQDRTIGKDILLSPKSGKIPLASFCVESGRWRQRGGETLEAFTSSNNALSSRDLKIAARKSKSQSEVWSNVSRQQDKVNESMVKNYDYADTFDVRDENSETSLQLTLENKELQKIKRGYEDFLKSISYDPTRTVGYVYAINGEVYGIDIFFNYKLFNDLWPKLRDAVIVEAISDDNDKEYKPVTKSDISTLISDFTNAKTETEKEEINSETTYITTSTDHVIQFKTYDKREDNQLLHLNYITVDSSYMTEKTQQQQFLR